MERVDELTRNDLISEIEPKVKRRAAILNLPVYIGITKDYIVQMKIQSSKKDKDYIVKIKLVEYPNIESYRDISTKDKVRLAITGDLAISCNCAAYRYWGYEYIMTQLSSNVGKDQNRYPQVRNPNLEGTLCKHCYRTITAFGSYWSKIAKDIDALNFVREVV